MNGKRKKEKERKKERKRKNEKMKERTVGDDLLRISFETCEATSKTHRGSRIHAGTMTHEIQYL